MGLNEAKGGLFDEKGQFSFLDIKRGNRTYKAFILLDMHLRETNHILEGIL